MHTCTMDVYGVRVLLSAPAGLLEHDLAPYLQTWRGGAGPRPPAQPVEIHVERHDLTHGQRYVMRRGSQPFAAAPDVASLMVQFQAWLDHEVVISAAPLIPVHAGVVGYAGQAVVIPAASGSGKTSMVAALLERGAVYYSDELALLDEEGWVLPYPRPLMVRDPAQNQHPVLPQRLNARVGTERLPVAVILAIDYHEGEQLSLERVSDGEGVVLLLRHAMIPDPMRPWPGVVKAATSARVFKGIRGEARAAAGEILSLLERATVKS